MLTGSALDITTNHLYFQIDLDVEYIYSNTTEEKTYNSSAGSYINPIYSTDLWKLMCV